MIHQPQSICTGVYRAAHVTQILPVEVLHGSHVGWQEQ